MGPPADPNGYSDYSVDFDQVRRNEIVATDGNNVGFRKELSIPDSMHFLPDEKEISTVSTVISPGLNLPKLSPDTTERVFPIRSVVSVDSDPSSALQTPSLEITESKTSAFGEGPWTFPVTSGKTWNQPSLSPAKEKCCEAVCSDPGLKDGLLLPAKTERNRSVTPLRMSKDGDQSSSISSGKPTAEGRQGTPGQLFHHLNSIQSFGTLIVLREYEGRLVVQVASKNSKDIVGYTPEELFELGCFCQILRPDQRDDFLEHARFIKDEDCNIEQHGPDILILFISTPSGGTKSFWCTLHTTGENMDYIICELEPEEDSLSVFTFVGDNKSGTDINGTTDSILAPKRSEESPSGVTRPLRALRVFSERKREFDLTNILNAMSRVLQLAWNAQTLDALFNGVIGVIRELIGFYRVTVYQFDTDWNSIAFADTVNLDASDAYRDMTPPVSVSSTELRRLHLLNKVCLLYGQNQSSAELVYRPSDAKTVPVDMTHCYLSTSKSTDIVPSHSSLSIGIYVFGNLWGLISCQTFEQDIRPLPPIHKLCWLISNTISSNVERLSYTLPFNIQEHSSTAEAKVYKCDTAPSGDITSLFGADCGASVIFDETRILGKPADSQEVLAVVEYLRLRKLNRIIWSTEISKDFQDLNYPPGFKYISGILYIPLSADCRDFIIFFRGSQWSESTFNTIGDGPESVESLRANAGPDKKSPYYRPQAWSAVDLGKAYILSVIYRTFIEVWQQKEAALQSTQLMRLLLANSAHEFRTPLNAIINYLEIALDGNLSQETRENLSRSHSASKSLIYIINDLLDLTNAENGQSLINDEVFNLSQTLQEAIDIFWEEAKQKHVQLHLVQHSKLPRVLGDQRRVRQVITNLISNAVQHTSSGAVTVESCILPDTPEPDNIRIEVAIHDTGDGMSEETMEALFCELEQVSNNDYIRKSCMDSSADGTGESKNVLGLGLALVARIVRNMDGQLSVKSEKNKGSCFKLRLKFPLPSSELDDFDSQHLMAEKAARSRGDKQHDDGTCVGQDTTQSNAQSVRQDAMPDNSAKESLDNTSCGNDLFPSTAHGNSDFDVGISVTTEESQLNHFTKPEHSNRSSPGAPRPPLVSMLSWPPSQDRKADAVIPPKPGINEPSNQCPGICQQQDKEKTDIRDNDKKSAQAKASTDKHSSSSPPEPAGDSTEPSLHVLVAEDDPINSTILRKRLEKFGHTVHMTGNGKECASVYSENPNSFDAILMDLQMPIVDGIGSTKMIRACNHPTDSTTTTITSSSTTETTIPVPTPRIPIFAVSASLLEKDRQTYIDTGFDGWIMKPIDFHRINHLLKGVRDEEIRNRSAYQSGMWEKGGWFEKVGSGCDGCGGGGRV